jgi:hypothetical protein
MRISFVCTEIENTQSNFYDEYLPKIRELFLDVWGAENPEGCTLYKTECIKEPENDKNFRNGGDYYYYLNTSRDFFWYSSSYVPSRTDRNDWHAGYFCGIPFVLYQNWIYWENGISTQIARSEAEYLLSEASLLISHCDRIYWNHEE